MIQEKKTFHNMLLNARGKGTVYIKHTYSTSTINVSLHICMYMQMFRQQLCKQVHYRPTKNKRQNFMKISLHDHYKTLLPFNFGDSKPYHHLIR